ncbi:MAG: shikimate dehydrogenase [Pseudomonadota bacterium]|nr:shikimate dehydrogenase [Pseudomonadota bacterium]NLX30589.1 shikimate dehydrogenase [Deltaproteobacteria bacterium]HNU85667.1 shikimate dehydrogenase [Syntrophales bacterium]HNZ35180.1 shikimate dehydrogenase [Syntrophales bacterium]HOF73591.1 shikimate dehydrogenase [Syntrophales bacterium]
MKERVRHFALFGNPVGHSLSPLMINAAFGAMGIRAGYEARRVEDLEPAVRMIREKPLDGVSVTLPHKGAVMAFLDEAEDDARAIGAVNTVTNERGWLRGSNTDWKGLTAAMEERFPLGGRTIAVLGAGGVARAAVHAILRAGGMPIVFNRSRDRADSLARWFSCETQPLARLGAVGADVLINATPVGMHPRTGESPVDARLLPRFEWVVDTIYNPLQTRLLREARAAGCGVVTGLSMFVRQGAEQIRTWTGLDPPVELMERVVRTALEAKDRLQGPE